MIINGRECSIMIRTNTLDFDVPFSDETLREAVSILKENASIEGDGVCRGIRKKIGVTGCVVTPLTLWSAPLLFYLAMGATGGPVLVSETKNLFKYDLNLAPLDDADYFELLQDRGNESSLFVFCRVTGFELRILRDEAIKLKLNITGEYSTMDYKLVNDLRKDFGERFNGNNVTYKINGREYKNIYGVTLVSNKKNGTKTELWIKRTLQNDTEIPFDIERMVITAQLVRDKYESRYYGTFSITIERLVLMSDETEIKASGAVMGPLRFYVSGMVSTKVYTSEDLT